MKFLAIKNDVNKHKKPAGKYALINIFLEISGKYDEEKTKVKYSVLACHYEFFLNDVFKSQSNFRIIVNSCREPIKSFEFVFPRIEKSQLSVWSPQ